MNATEKFWDRTAKSYDREERKDAPTYRVIVEKTKAYLKPSDIVLDDGCGTGLVCHEIAGSVAQIHAIDISSKMIELARQKAEVRGIQNIEYAHATLFDPRYENGSFDVILAFYMLHLLDDLPAAIRRMADLLKPGGLLISATPCLGEKKGLQSAGLSFLGKIGLVPPIQALKVAELEAIIGGGNFAIVETASLDQRSPQYFIAARKC